MNSPEAGLHSHGHGAGGKSLRTALLITSVVFVIELAGGIYSNSLALLADAGHMLTDVGALGLSLFALWFSSKPATPSKTFGFYRVEILAALLNGILLVLIALYVLYEAYGRLRSPEAIRGEMMLLVAMGGLGANVLSAYVLFGHQSESLNVRGAFFHVLGDALGSVGAILASIAILVFGWTWADAAISAIVAVLILSSSWVLIRDAIDILLEGAPAHINIRALRDQLVGAQGVGSVHDVHVWTLTSGVVAMSCHVVVGRDELLGSEVLETVSRIASEKFGIDHTTIQIETDSGNAGSMESCNCRFGAG